jgi:hypothetical protein
MFQQFEDFSDDQVVKFVYEDGCDVFHFNETHIETALQETSTVARLAEALASGIVFEDDPLDDLRMEGWLDEYERADDRVFSGFREYLAETINENFYEMYNLIEETTEKYDHKRGFTNLRTELVATVGDLRNMKLDGPWSGNPFSHWTAEVNTPKGTLSFTVED